MPHDKEIKKSIFRFEDERRHGRLLFVGFVLVAFLLWRLEVSVELLLVIAIFGILWAIHEIRESRRITEWLHHKTERRGNHKE